MKHDVGGKVSTKKTLMNRISVSFYCIDFLIALAWGAFILFHCKQKFRRYDRYGEPCHT